MASTFGTHTCAGTVVLCCCQPGPNAIPKAVVAKAARCSRALSGNQTKFSDRLPPDHAVTRERGQIDGTEIFRLPCVEPVPQRDVKPGDDASRKSFRSASLVLSGSGAAAEKNDASSHFRRCELAREAPFATWASAVCPRRRGTCVEYPSPEYRRTSMARTSVFVLRLQEPPQNLRRVPFRLLTRFLKPLLQVGTRPEPGCVRGVVEYLADNLAAETTVALSLHLDEGGNAILIHEE